MNEMSAALQLAHHVTGAEFLAWHPGDGQSWRLVDGEPQARVPASDTDGSIQSECVRLFANHLIERGSKCRVVIDPGIQPLVRASGSVRTPDLGVTCSPPRPGAPLMAEPLLAVEILSPSSLSELAGSHP